MVIAYSSHTHFFIAYHDIAPKIHFIAYCNDPFLYSSTVYI